MAQHNTNPLTDDYRKEQEQVRNQAKKIADNHRKDLDAIASTDPGLRFLRRLFDLTLADKAILAQKDDGSINTELTLINEGKRQVWLKLKENMSRHTYNILFGTNVIDPEE